MKRDELMALSAEKAASELSWKSIEFLFRPSNLFELMLRSDMEGAVAYANREMHSDAPDAMPYRHRQLAYAPVVRAIEVERLYRAIKRALPST